MDANLKRLASELEEQVDRVSSVSSQQSSEEVVESNKKPKLEVCERIYFSSDFVFCSIVAEIVMRLKL